MKRVNITSNILGFLFFCVFLLLILINDSLSKIDYIIIIIAEIFCFFGAFNFYYFDQERILIRFLFYKKEYYLKEISSVQGETFFTYTFTTKRKNLPKIHLNFLFQKKLRKQLFIFIEYQNPSCLFINI